jgi:predicted Zn-dependent protease with MMP-like domain
VSAAFEELVARALDEIPAPFRARLENVAFVVEDEPSRQQLARLGGGTLLGLYEGRPLTQRTVFQSVAMPDRITIFEGPHRRMAMNPAHLRRLVSETVWHEVAHYFGMDERQVRAAERRRRRR